MILYTPSLKIWHRVNTNLKIILVTHNAEHDATSVMAADLKQKYYQILVQKQQHSVHNACVQACHSTEAW